MMNAPFVLGCCRTLAAPPPPLVFGRITALYYKLTYQLHNIYQLYLVLFLIVVAIWKV